MSKIQNDEQNDIIHGQVISAVDINSIGVRSRGQRRRCSLSPVGESLTKQSDHDRACIHKIIKNYENTGILPQRPEGIFNADDILPDVDSYHDAMNIVVDAQQKFNALPSDVRERFHNSPERMLQELANPKNRQEMVDLGLMNPVGEGANAPSQTKNAPSPDRPTAGEGDGAGLVEAS